MNRALGAATAAVGMALAAVGTPALAKSGPSTGCEPGWSTFQHDLAHTGAGCGAMINPSNVATLHPGWFVPTANAVTSEPIVAGGTLYVGDNGGAFHAIDAATGVPRWTFSVTSNDPATGKPYDSHPASYGEITSSATYTDQVKKAPPLVVFGGGGSVFALNAGTGQVVWHTDMDPTDPTGPVEVESTPVVLPGTDGSGVVLVGTDTNESTHGVTGGFVALDARNGAPIWSFEPDTNQTSPGLPSAGATGCNDVWSSPAVDPEAAGTGLVFFGTGNCPSGQADIEALSLVDGQPRWHFTEPAANHGGDDDFGSSPVITSVRGTPAVVEAGKSGWIYTLNELSGAPINSAQVAEPGQTGDSVGGAIGGFIGALALAPVGSDPVAFGNSAIPAPFTGDGISSSGATPDTSLTADPTRASSLHAYDVATGKVLWHQPLQGPAYAPVTVVNGVLFAPSTASFSINAFDTATGRPLWAFPLGASPSSGVSVVGSSIFFGSGTYENVGTPLPPQATGIWMFRLLG